MIPLIALILSHSISAWAAPSAIQASDVWIRKVPKEVPHTAAYLVLTNPTDQEIKLIGATTSIAKTVELHTHVARDGGMKMEQVESIAIPAHGKVQLQPKGLHLMVLFLKTKFESAKKVSFTLKFSDGSSQIVSADVRGFDQPSHSH